MAAVPPLRRVDRRLRLEGFAERDGLVVRSMVRLLDGRTRDHWQLVDADPVHVLIVPVGAELPSTGAERVVHVGLPLRADDLWSQLDRASGALDEADQMLRPSARTAAAPGSPSAPKGLRRLQLLRWPPDEVLGADLRHLRLATMLGSRPFAMDELAARSGIPLATCHTFAAVLHANGVAQWLIDDEVAAPPADPSGLIARIRAKLRPEGSR